MLLEERRRAARIRREAQRLGLRAMKQRAGHDAGRYLMIDVEKGGALPSHNRTWPYSFSVDEAEALLSVRQEKQVDRTPSWRRRASAMQRTVS